MGWVGWGGGSFAANLRVRKWRKQCKGLCLKSSPGPQVTPDLESQSSGFLIPTASRKGTVHSDLQAGVAPSHFTELQTGGRGDRGRGHRESPSVSRLWRAWCVLKGRHKVKGPMGPRRWAQAREQGSIRAPRHKDTIRMLPGRTSTHKKVLAAS